LSFISGVIVCSFLLYQQQEQHTNSLLQQNSLVSEQCGSLRFKQPIYMQPLPHFGSDIVWVGHLIPDADSVASAVAAALLFSGQPMVPGTMNRETKFLLETFGIEKPVRLRDGYKMHQSFGLVDHNAHSQRAKLLNASFIVAIIDHHALAFEPTYVPKPIYVEVRPWGSCSAIVATKFLEHGETLPPKFAGLLMGGIISDTLNLKSPTTTHWDKQALHWLSTIVQWDLGGGQIFQGGCLADGELQKQVNKFAKKQFIAKANLTDWPLKKITLSDIKAFELETNRSRETMMVGWGTIETVEPFYSNYLTNKALEDFTQVIMPEILHEKLWDLFYISIVDILEERSNVICFTRASCSLLAISLGMADQGIKAGHIITTPRVSRKKEFLPAIREVLRGNHS